jgi:enoyl-CoA hydratase
VEILLNAVYRSPVRTVAAAHGRTWGAGADLFAACDVRLAAPDAHFRFPGAGFGLVLGTRRLAQRVGAGNARRFTCDGVAMECDEALSAGLVTGQLDGAQEIPSQFLAPPATDRHTVAALRAATADDGADADLAALVRSACQPGLKARIIAYKQGLKPAARSQ